MEGNKIKLSEIFDELQDTVDNITDSSIKKAYCAACVTIASMIINKTDPYTDSLIISFEEAYNDIKSFKLKNGI